MRNQHLDTGGDPLPVAEAQVQGDITGPKKCLRRDLIYQIV